MKPKTLLYCLCFIAVTGAGCRNTRITRTDTPTSGIATVVSDDCFGNIFGEEIDVFEALNREASLLPVLMGEAQAVQLLLNDSVRLAVLARDLTDAEKGLIHSRNRELVPGHSGSPSTVSRSSSTREIRSPGSASPRCES